MASRARSLRRRKVASQYQLTVNADLAREAAVSLNMPLQDYAEALATMNGAHPNPTEANIVSSAVLMARLLELAELLNLVDSNRAAGVRAMLLRDYGASFLQRVSCMGEPASEAAARYATSHKIHFGKLALFPRTSYHNPSGWIRSSGSFVASGRRSTSLCSFRIGCGRGVGSSRGRGNASRSYSSGGSGVCASVTFQRAIRTSRSSTRTGGSSGRRTSDAAVRP